MSSKRHRWHCVLRHNLQTTGNEQKPFFIMVINFFFVKIYYVFTLLLFVIIVN